MSGERAAREYFISVGCLHVSSVVCASVCRPCVRFYAYIYSPSTNTQNFNGSLCTPVNGPHLHLYNIPFQLPQHRELCGGCDVFVLCLPLAVGLILKQLPETSSQLPIHPHWPFFHIVFALSHRLSSLTSVSFSCFILSICLSTPFVCHSFCLPLSADFLSARNTRRVAEALIQSDLVRRYNQSAVTDSGFFDPSLSGKV